MSRAARRLASLALLALAVAACGKKGPPVAPELRLPSPPTALSAYIDDGAILVTWTNPITRMDGSRLRDLMEVRLYRREDPDGSPPKPAMLSGGRIVGYQDVANIQLAAPEPATVSGTSVKWVDDDALVPGRRYVYVVTAIDALGRSSLPSERGVITFLAAPKPPDGLQATPASHQVTLKWNAPTEFTDGTAVKGDVRYMVLRGAGSEGPLAIITPDPLTATSFTDTGLANDTEYRYAVRAVRVDPQATAGGPPSEVVSAMPIETERPAAPTNLAAVPSPGAVRLAWSASPTANVALYAVYRAARTGAPLRVGTTLAGNTTFIDRDVRAGATYRYTVTAIDSARTPNESERSNEVTISLP